MEVRAGFLTGGTVMRNCVNKARWQKSDVTIPAPADLGRNTKSVTEHPP